MRMPPYGFVAYDQIDSGLNQNGPFLVSIVGVDRLENWAEIDSDAKRIARSVGWIGSSLTLTAGSRGSRAPRPARNVDRRDVSSLSQYARRRDLRLRAAHPRIYAVGENGN